MTPVPDIRASEKPAAMRLACNDIIAATAITTAYGTDAVANRKRQLERPLQNQLLRK